MAQTRRTRPNDDAFAKLLGGRLHPVIDAALCEHLRTRRWFRSKARVIQTLRGLDLIPLCKTPQQLVLVLLQVGYESGPAEIYVVPLGFAPGRQADAEVTAAALFRARFAPGGPRGRSVEGTVFDPSATQLFCQQLLSLFARRSVTTRRGKLQAASGAALRERLSPDRPEPGACRRAGDSSNTTLFFGQELMLKLFQQLEDGENPDAEINAFVWQRGYRHVPEPLGELKYVGAQLRASLAVAQRFVPSEGTAWGAALQHIEGALEAAAERVEDQREPELPHADLLDSAGQTLPQSTQDLLAPSIDFVRLLAKRTAELHTVLASERKAKAFAPEPFSRRYVQSLVHAARARLDKFSDLLQQQLPRLPEPTQVLAREVLAARPRLLEQLEAARGVEVQAARIRCHGDYHLGQVLYTGSDFVILDFEGEPAQSLAARRAKGSALYDVSGMLRSFDYAATVGLAQQPEARQAALAAYARAWYRWTSALFVGAYLAEVRAHPPAVFLPSDDGGLRALLGLHLLDKCSYELGYELNNRPDWVSVPLHGLRSLAGL